MSFTYIVAFHRLEGGEEAEEGYTKGVIVSFTAKKTGVSNGAEKTEETTATATEGADVEEDTLTREDIKGSLGKFGIVRVSLLLFSQL